MILLAASLLAAAPSKADVPEVRFAQQFSMGYLQFNGKWGKIGGTILPLRHGRASTRVPVHEPFDQLKRP